MPPGEAAYGTDGLLGNPEIRSVAGGSMVTAATDAAVAGRIRA